MTTLTSLLPGTRGVATRDSGSKSTELDIVGPFCNLFELAFARYTVPTSSSKSETAVHGYGYTFIGS